MRALGAALRSSASASATARCQFRRHTMPLRPNAGPAASTAAVSAPPVLTKKVVAAAEAGKVGVVQTWLTGAGRVNATCQHRGLRDCTLLMIATSYGHKQLVEMLLKRGAEADAQNSNGGTALMAAAQYGHEQVAEMLIQHGAEVNLQSSEGWTALASAAASGHLPIVLRLLRAGAVI